MSNSNIRLVKYNEELFKIPSKTQKRKKPDKPIKIKSEKKTSNKSKPIKKIIHFNYSIRNQSNKNHILQSF